MCDVRRSKGKKVNVIQILLLKIEQMVEKIKDKSQGLQRLKLTTNSMWVGGLY